MAGNDTAATQPRPMYMNPDTTCRSVRQSFTPTPASAPAHTIASSTSAAVPCITSRQNGVYVPAISRKIMEWSARRHQLRC